MNYVPIADPLTEMCVKYSYVFNADRGVISGVKTKLQVAKDATSKFYKARSVPYALSSVVYRQLTKLQEQGVLTPVEYSEWATPLVCIPKTNGEVRMCGD